MENHVNRKSSDLDRKIPPALEFENCADAAGLWFAAAVLCAVLAAGVIVYRTGSADYQTASNVVQPATAQASH